MDLSIEIMNHGYWNFQEMHQFHVCCHFISLMFVNCLYFIDDFILYLVTLNAVDLLNWVQFDDNATLDSLLDDFFNEFDVDQNGFLPHQTLCLMHNNNCSLFAETLSLTEFEAGMSWFARVRSLSPCICSCPVSGNGVSYFR
jgi:hypothetical protein